MCINKLREIIFFNCFPRHGLALATDPNTLNIKRLGCLPRNFGDDVEDICTASV